MTHHSSTSPLFHRVDIDRPLSPGSTESKKLRIISRGGPKIPDVKSDQVNGVYLGNPIIQHEKSPMVVSFYSRRVRKLKNGATTLKCPKSLDSNIGQLVSKLRVHNNCGSIISFNP